MRATPILTGAALVLVAAGAVMAASPAPSATPKPPATPAPSTAPSTTSKAPATTKPAAGSAATTWSATINPLNVTTGTASITQAADGTGTITITLHGLLADTPWTVDVDSGTSTLLNDSTRHEIASRSGAGVEKVSSGTVRIHLTAAEMKAFLRERAANGAVILVTDGTNRSAAVFPAG